MQQSVHHRVTSVNNFFNPTISNAQPECRFIPSATATTKQIAYIVEATRRFSHLNPCARLLAGGMRQTGRSLYHTKTNVAYPNASRSIGLNHKRYFVDTIVASSNIVVTPRSFCAKKESFGGRAYNLWNWRH